MDPITSPSSISKLLVEDVASPSQKCQPWRAFVAPRHVRSQSPTLGDKYPDIRLQEQRDEHGGAGG